MKFRKFKFENHPILRNCCFDFTDSNGNVVDTIIIAGENGCGKTIFLNELFSYNPFDIIRNKSGKSIVEIELNDSELAVLNSDLSIHNKFRNGIKNGIFTILQDFDNKGLEQTKVIIEGIYCNHSVLGQIRPALFRSIYSDVEINFTPNSIKSITSQNIDQKSKSFRSSNGLATEISQLIIDIKSLDDADIADWVNENPGKIPPEEIKSIRMKRFTNAFHSMFENKRFKGIRNQNGEKIIEFEENGNTMSIDKLSSGEKQIVFRGGFLLKDKNSIMGATVLVDEPEISLHPRWQMGILPFIKNLFKDNEGKQTSQIVIATHSPFIIHNDNRGNDKVIVLQKDDGRIGIVNIPEFYSWGAPKIVKEAFYIDLNFETEDKKIVFVEGETDEKYYNKALDVYGFNKTEIEIEWIGRRTNKGVMNTGKDALNNAAKVLMTTNLKVVSQIYLLYDVDTNKPNEDEGNLHIRSMSKNSHNQQFEIGVENLLVLPQNFDFSPYYTSDVSFDNYKAKKTIEKFNKMLFCDDICKKSDDELKTILSNVKTEIQKILTN